MVFKRNQPDRAFRPVRFFNLTLSLFALFMLPGCNAGFFTPTPIPGPSVPTIVAMTAAALPSHTPVIPTETSTATPSITPSPTLTPTPYKSPLPTLSGKLPLAAIRILAPGPMSKVVSPIVLKSYITPGDEGLIQVELIGEDGRLLAREIFRQPTIYTDGTYVKMEIPFETRAIAEVGRLQISTKDEFGRQQDVKSVHLFLLSEGRNDINAGDTEPRVLFTYPKADAEIFGGELPVTGEFQSYNDEIVILELVDERGKTIGLRTLNIPAGRREKFETTIEYAVKERVSARLVIRQADDNFEGRVYLHSQVVILNP